MVIIDGQFWVGIGLLLLLTLSPGASFALISGIAVGSGRGAAFVASLGIATGVVAHSAASALGLSVVLAASPEAFMLVKGAGAVYLAYLGVRTLLRSRTRRATVTTQPSASAFFTRGLLTNLLNPQVAIFYLTFLPQFIHSTEPVLAKSLLFGVSHAAIVVSWFAGYAYGLTSLASRVRALQPWIERFSGVVLIAFALRLLQQSR
jgi:threonine/homoserine/homoserine lactone efflux protein